MTNTRILSDVAEISPGFSIPGAIEHEPSGTYQLILPRHLDEGGRPFVYNQERHALRMTLSERAERYLVQPGDVLFISRGEKNRAVVIHACPRQTVVPTTFYVIRPNPALVLPDYLAWYLNQVPAQAAIAQIRTGSGTPIVQRADFEMLPAFVPALQKQQAIARLNNLMLTEQDLRRRLSDAVSRRNRSIGRSLIELNPLDELHRGHDG